MIYGDYNYVLRAKINQYNCGVSTIGYLYVEKKHRDYPNDPRHATYITGPDFDILKDNKDTLIKEFADWLKYSSHSCLMFADNLMTPAIDGMWWGRLIYVVEEFIEHPEYGIKVIDSPMWQNRMHGFWPCKIFMLFPQYTSGRQIGSTIYKDNLPQMIKYFTIENMCKLNEKSFVNPREYQEYKDILDSYNTKLPDLKEKSAVGGKKKKTFLSKYSYT